MFKRKYILILALFMVLLSCFAVSASEDVNHTVTIVNDDISENEVVSVDDSIDESIRAQNDEQASDVNDSALSAENDDEKEVTGQSSNEPIIDDSEENIKDIYVSDVGNDTNPGTEKSPYATINHALNNVTASDNVVVHLSEGNFGAEGNSALNVELYHNIDGGSLKIIGAGPSLTVIDGENLGDFFAKIGRGSNVTISGITFINFKTSSSTITSYGNLIVDNCIFKNISGGYYGGAISALDNDKATLKVTNSQFISCSISQNSEGGAIYVSGFGYAYVENSTFINTSTPGSSGSAIYVMVLEDNTYIVNNKFINITAKSNAQDASIFVLRSGSIINNTFINCLNPSTTFSTVYLGGGNNIFERNTFIDSANSVGNVYLGGFINTLNLIIFAPQIIISNDEINNGLIFPATVTDDMGNIIYLNFVPLKLTNSENSYVFTAINLGGVFLIDFTQVPANGIYNVSWAKIDFTTGSYGESTLIPDVTFEVSCDNDPVDLWVSPEGSDADNGTQEYPFKTIEKAINVGFEKSYTVNIHLVNGTYTGEGNVNLDVSNKGTVNIIGEKYGEVILDGEGKNKFISIGQTTFMNINNVTFTNGGGNNLISGNNQLFLKDCIVDSNKLAENKRVLYRVIFDNLVYTNNAGIIYFDSSYMSIDGSPLEIKNSYFANNINLGDGGVIYNGCYDAIIENCKFINNTATNGGAVYAASVFTSKNNYYEGNRADNGGAIYSMNYKFNSVNDTFINNHATDNGVFGSGIKNSNFDHSFFINSTGCKFINNSAIDSGVCGIKTGIFTDCSFINNTADYGGVFSLYVIADRSYFEEVWGVDEANAKYGGVYELKLESVSFEGNTAKINGDDIYMVEKGIHYASSVPNENLLYAIDLTINFNNLNVSSLVDVLTADISGPCGAKVGGNTITFMLDDVFAGTNTIVNSGATYKYSGFEEGTFVLTGNTQYPSKNNTISNGTVIVKLEGIVSHIDYWVSNNGSDEAGNGSEDNPFKTISYAVEKASQTCHDIVIHLGEETYTDLALELSSMSNITIIGVGVNKTILNGGNTSYLAVITHGKNKVAFSNLTIEDMVADNRASKTIGEMVTITVDEGANLVFDNILLTNCHGGQGIILNNGNLYIFNSEIIKNGISTYTIYGGNVSIDNSVFEANFVTSGLLSSTYSSINNSEIKNIFNINTGFSLIGGSAIIENTVIDNDGDNSSLKLLGIDEVNTKLNPALAIYGNVIMKNVSISNNFKSPLSLIETMSGQPFLAPFGLLYAGKKNVSVSDSTFSNFKYLWAVNTINNVNFKLSNCIFNNISMICYSSSPGALPSYVISDSIFLNSGSIIYKASSNKEDPNYTFDDNYWGNNSVPIVTYINPGKETSFAPNTWIILTAEDGVPSLKVTDGENVSDYVGKLPAEISFIDYNGSIVPVLNVDGTGYLLSTDENGTVSINASNPIENIVPKVATNITVTAEDIVMIVNDGSVFTAVFNDKWGDPLANTYVTFTINGVVYNATTDANSTAVLPITFAEGVYTVTTTNPVTGQSIKNTITVVDHTVTAKDVTLTYKEDVSFTAKFTDKYQKALANAIVFFIIGNETINATTDENGTAILPIALDVGIYNITATNPVTAQSITKTITVNKLNTIISASDVKTVYNGGKYLVVNLKDANGNVIQNAKVTIKIGSKTYNKITDSKGQVKISTNGLKVTTHKVTLNYEGDSIHVASTAYSKVVVSKAKPKLTAKAKTFKAKVKTKKYTIVLKTNKNKVLKNVKVTIKVGKKTFKATTNKKGKATFKITKLTKKGTYKAKIKTKSTAYYTSVSKTVKIKVKK